MKTIIPYSSKIQLDNFIKKGTLTNVYEKNYYIEQSLFNSFNKKSRRKFIKKQSKRTPKFTYTSLNIFFDRYTNLAYSQNDYTFSDRNYTVGFSYFAKPKNFLNNKNNSFDFKDLSYQPIYVNSFLTYFLKKIYIHKTKLTTLHNLLPIRVLKGGILSFFLAKYVFIPTNVIARTNIDTFIKLFNKTHIYHQLTLKISNNNK